VVGRRPAAEVLRPVQARHTTARAARFASGMLIGIVPDQEKTVTEFGGKNGKLVGTDTPGETRRSWVGAGKDTPRSYTERL